MATPAGPQYIDTEFTDLFTDASARYSQYGVDSLSQQAWRFDITERRGVFTIRAFLNGVLTNVNASSTTPLSQSATLFNVTRSPSTAVASVAASAWVNVSTGIYTVDLSATTFVTGSHIAEVIASTTYTNPTVTSKTSVITALSASYAQQTLTSIWTAESMPFAISTDGQFADAEACVRVRANYP